MKSVLIILLFIFSGIFTVGAQYYDPAAGNFTNFLGHNLEAGSTAGSGSSVIPITVNGFSLSADDMSKYAFYVVNYVGMKMGESVFPMGFETLGDVQISSIIDEGGARKAVFTENNNYPNFDQGSSIAVQNKDGVVIGIALTLDNTDLSMGVNMIYWEVVIVNKESGYCATTGLQTDYTEVALDIIDPTIPTPSLGPTFDVKDLADCWPLKFDLNSGVNNLSPADATLAFYTDEACTVAVTNPGQVGSATNPSTNNKLVTTYWVKATSAGESTTKSFTVTEYQKPEIELAFDNGVSNPICQGAAVDLVANNKNGFTAGQYLFSLKNTSQIDVNNGTNKYSIDNIRISDVCTVKVITGNTVGKCEATASLDITVQDMALAASSNILLISNPASNAICKGESMTLTAMLAYGVSGVDFQWDAPVAGEDQNKAQITVSPQSTTTYKVHGKIGSCVAETGRTVEVTVNSVPTVKITNPGAICAGNTIDLTGTAITSGSTAGLTYSYWSDPECTTSLSNANAVAASGTYYIKGTTDKGCADSKSVTATVNPLPVPEIVVAGNKISECSGATLTLTAKPDGATYAWSGASTATTKSITPTIVDGANSFSLTVTDVKNCSATIATPVVITGTPSPQVNITPVKESDCADATINLEAKVTWAGGTSKQSVLWTGSTVANADQESTTAVLAAGDNLYRLKATDNNGCSDEEEIKVKGNKLGVILNGNNGGTVKAGTDVTLSAIAKLNNVVTSNVTYQFEEVSPNPQILTSSGNSVVVAPVEKSVYRVTVMEKTLGCTAVSTDYTIEVTQDPFIVNNVAGVSVCSGTDLTVTPMKLSVTATGGVPDYTYEWTVPAGITVTGKDASELQITAIDYTTVTGLQEVSVKVTDKNGLNDTKTAIVQINPLPTVLIAGKADGESLDACLGVALNLTASISGSTGGTFTWGDPVAAANKNKNPIAVDVANEGMITYTVTGKDGNQCENTASLKVTVNPLPVVNLTAQVAGADVTDVCPDTEVTLAASSDGITDPAAYTWSGAANGLDASIGGTVKPVAPSSTYIVSVFDGKCHSENKQASVNVYTPGTLAISTESTSVCSGSTVVLTASGGSDYVWSGTPAGTGAGNTLTVILDDSQNNYTYEVNGKDEHGCEAKEGTATITIAPMPVLILAESTLHGCLGSKVDLWGAVNRAGLSAGTALKVTKEDGSAASGTEVSTGGTYRIALSAGQCTTETQDVKVEYHALPNAVLAVLYGTDSECSGETITLQASSEDADRPNYTWEDRSTGDTRTVKLENTGSTDLNKPYTVIAENTYCSKEVKKTVTIKPLPKVTITDPGTVCANIELTLTPNGASSYLWNDGIEETAHKVIPTITNHEYSVVGTGANGCKSQSVSINLTVVEPPVLSMSELGAVCAGIPLDLAAAVNSTGFSLKYFGPDGTTILEDSKITPETSGSYYVQGTPNGGRCPTPKAEIKVNVLPKPQISISGEEVICKGETVELTAQGGVSYTWEDLASNQTTIQVTPDKTTTYKVTGKGTNNCTADATFEVLVNPLPVLAWNNAPTEVMENTSVTLKTTLQSGTQAPYIYAWTAPSGQEANKSDECTIIATTPSVHFAVSVTDGHNCTSEVLEHDLSVTPVGGELTVQLQTPSTEICAGGMQILTVKVSGGTPGYSYKWFKDDVEIPDETLASLIVTEAGRYKVEVKDQGTTVQTKTVEKNMTVGTTAAPTVTIADQTILPNSMTILVAEVSPAAAGYTYTWSGELAANQSTEEYPQTTILTAGEHQYELYVTASNKCRSKVAKGTVRAEDNAFNVVASVALSDICKGGTNRLGVVLKGNNLPTESDVSYEWMPAKGLTPNAFVKNPVFTASESGDQQFVVKVSDKSGHTAFAAVSFFVMDLQAPTLQLSKADDVTCTNVKVQVTSTGSIKAGTYSWIVDDVEQPQKDITEMVFTEAGLHHVKVSAEGGNRCPVDTVEMNYEIQPSPTIAWDPSNIESAEIGMDVTLRAIANEGAEGDYTYSWSSPTTGTAQANRYTLKNIQSTTTFKVKVTDNVTHCSSSEISARVGITAATPDIIFATNVESDILCTGGSSVLEVTKVKGGVGHEDVFEDYTYTWTKGAIELTTERMLSVTEAGTYVIVVRDKNGKSKEKQIIVTSSDLRAPKVTGSTLLIATNTQTYLFSEVSGGKEPYQYYWSPADKLSSAATLASPQTVKLDADQTYHYYVKDENNCSSSLADVEVQVVGETDGRLFTVTAVADRDKVCPGNQVVLGANTSRILTNPTYEWTPVTGLTLTDPKHPVFAATTVGTYEYTVKVTDNGVSATSTVSIEVGSGVAPKLQLEDKGECAGEKLVANVTEGAVAANGYHWIVAGVPDATVTGNEYALGTGVDQEVKVYVVSQDGNCFSDTVSGIYSRKPRPELTWSTEGGMNPQFVYLNESIAMKVEANPETNVKYWWKSIFTPKESVAETPSTDDDSDYNDYQVLGKAEGVYKFEVYAKLEGCSSETLTKEVTVKDKNAGLFVTTDQVNVDVCKNGAAIITATASNGDASSYTYIWYKGITVDEAQKVAVGEKAMLIPATNAQKYIVEVTDGSGAKAVSAPVTLNFSANTAPSVTGVTQTIASGNSAILLSNVLGNSKPYTYNWTPANKLATGEVKKTNPKTIALNTDQDYEYYVEDAVGCISQKATVKVLVETGADVVSIVAKADRTQLCKGNQVKLSVETLSGKLSDAAAYQWTSDKGSTYSVANPVFTLDVADKYEYTVKVTDQGKVMTAKVSFTVQDKNAPKLEWPVSNPTTYQVGDPLAVSVNVQGGGVTPLEYTWVTPTARKTAIGTYTVDPTTVAKYDFAVFVTDGNGCLSDTLNKTVTASGSATEPIEVEIKNLMACAAPAGDAVWVKLPVKVTSAHTDVAYSWETVGSNDLPLTNQAKDTALVNIAGAIAGNYPFEVTITDNQHTENNVKKELILKINPAPEVALDQKELIVHKDDSFVLNVVNPTNYTYIWGVSMYDIENDQWKTGGEGDGTNATLMNGVMKNQDIRYVITATEPDNLCESTDTAYVYRIPDAPKVGIDTADNRLTIKLNWNAVAGADDYTVWSRKWDPYSMIVTEEGNTYKTELAQTTIREWVESKMDTLEFYYVTANRNIGGQSFRSIASDTVGYYLFDIPYSDAKSTSYSFMPVYFNIKEVGISKTKDLFEILSATNIDYIRRWEYPSNPQIFSQARQMSPVLVVGDFDIEQGDVLQFQPKVKKGVSSYRIQFMQYGKLPMKYSIDLLNTNTTTSNFNITFMLPHRLDYKMAKDVLLDKSDIEYIRSWNYSKQIWDQLRLMGAGTSVGTNFYLNSLQPLQFELKLVSTLKWE